MIFSDSGYKLFFFYITQISQIKCTQIHLLI